MKTRKANGPGTLRRTPRSPSAKARALAGCAERRPVSTDAAKAAAGKIVRLMAIYCSGLQGGSGGESGIRTHGRVSPTHAFQACSFNRSDISPGTRLARSRKPVYHGVHAACGRPGAGRVRRRRAARGPGTCGRPHVPGPWGGPGSTATGGGPDARLVRACGRRRGRAGPFIAAEPTGGGGSDARLARVRGRRRGAGRTFIAAGLPAAGGARPAA